MRKPRLNEVAIMGYASYMWFTLTIDPELFERTIERNPSSLYQSYIDMVGSQSNLAWISLAVAFSTLIVLFFRNYNVRIISSVIGLIYFTFVSVSYVFNYPNLALGSMAIIIGWLIVEINRLIDEGEEHKKKIILKDSLKEGIEEE